MTNQRKLKRCNFKESCFNKNCTLNNQVDHRTARNIDERTIVEGLEDELVGLLKPLMPGIQGDRVDIVNHFSALIDAKIELDRVQVAVISGIKQDPIHLDIDVVKDENQSLNYSIDSSLELEDLPAFLPLTEFTPEQFATIRNGDRFNVDGRTMHIRFEKKYIPGLRSLKVIKGSD